MAKLATAVGNTLAEGGVRHAFGVVGGGNILAVAGLTDAGVNYVAARHEGGAIAMADAYHRVSGEVAVCTGSHGPGMTNLVTGLAEAAKHGSGVLVLVGDAPTTGPRRNDVDQTAIAEGAGAEVVRLADPATARAETARALQLARTRRCPVLLCLPNDLLGVEVPDGPVSWAEPVVEPVPVGDLSPVLDALAGARRPLLLAGLGAWRSDSGKSIVDLGDRLGALYATTAMANGLFAGNPWSLGICGGFTWPAATEFFGRADVVVVFGASLDVFTLHGGRLLAADATVIQVDIDAPPTADRVDLAVTGDASAVATGLLDGLDARGARSSSWRTEVEDELATLDGGRRDHVDESTTDRIDPRTVTKELAPLLPAERTLVLDGGHFIAWPTMYWPVADPAAMVFLGAASQSIGMGFAGAVGAVCGRTDRTTVVALGDGGALMGLSELDTLVRTADSVLVVIYDDAAYGFEGHLYGPQGADLRTVEFDETDFAGIATALGAQASTVRVPADLAEVRAWLADGAAGTFVLDCKVVPEVIAHFLEDLISGH